MDNAARYALIDLHLHLDGSLPHRAVRALAAREDVRLPTDDGALAARLAAPPDCRDLNDYLSKFELPCALLQTGEALALASEMLAEDLRAEGLLYAEIRFAPSKHTARGLSQEGTLRAVLEGLSRVPLDTRLILCCMRGACEGENTETLRLAASYLGRGVVAADLAGAEALYANEAHAMLFALARALSLPMTVHAGEAAGHQSVESALAFGACRIGHGVRAIESDTLVQTLAARRIPLEICPTSNVQTHAVPSLAAHPLPHFLRAGVCVTVNTDNRTVSRTTLAKEYARIAEAFALDSTALAHLALNAAEASLAENALKRKLHDAVRARLGIDMTM